MLKKCALFFLITMMILSGSASATTDISLTDLDITPDDLSRGDMAQLTAEYDIRTDRDDTKVVLSFYIDGNLEKSATRYYDEDDEDRFLTYTYSHDTEDMETGIHTAEVIAKIYRGTSLMKSTDSISRNFEIEEHKRKIDLTMNIYPKDATIGENIHVFGYVDPTDEIIDIMVDGLPKKTAFPNANGYYSTFLKIDSYGAHTITSSVEDSVNQETVRVRAKDKTTTDRPAQDKTRDIIITIKTPETKDGTDDIPQDGIDDIEIPGKDDRFNYIKVMVSNKVLDVNRYESNMLRITVGNHDNESHLFTIDSDFDNDMVFLPEPEVIDEGQKKMLPVYFSVDKEPGRYYGIIYVRHEDDIVREIPITVFVSENDDIGKQDSSFYGPLDTDAMIVIVSIILIITIMMLIRRSSSKKIEPLELSSLKG